ncbi:MAG: cytochrome b/b6 domain-containing protein, partial [Candidatus Omnitrophota bacterium]|nr:cytochrome b/b6 domain-containing protein [Candidatus Omnitrophota bacterium]
MRKRCRNYAISAALLLFIGILFSPVMSLCQEPPSNNDCLTCHDNIDIREYKASVHGPSLCTSCHSDARDIAHQEKPAKVNCANCHKYESLAYNASDHGQAAKYGIPAAGCPDCHGRPHAILDTRNAKSPAYRQNIPETCARCHDDEKRMAKYNLLEENPSATYRETVHGKALKEKGLASAAICTDCHGSHNLSSPANPKSRIYWSNVPSTCGRCHENVLNTYLRSVHGKAVTAGKRDAPVCTSCHGEHTIRSHKDPESSVYPTVIAKKTCGQCHAAEKIITKYRLPAGRVETYLQSYHGLAGKFGVTTVANCASCHGIHDILPANDPDSDVNKKNLPKTCGKCHPNAGGKLAKGSVHLAPSATQDRAVFYVTCIYILLIVLTIGGMLAHNTLDFLAELRIHYQKHQKKAVSIRFTTGERIQHLCLVSTFFLLAYTGFALRYREAWWALPFTIWNPGFDWRGIVHRIFAVIFVALVIYHGYYLFWTSRGKEQLKALMIKGRDFSDFFATMKYYFGIRKEKPKYARFNYVEKSEYWALAWGSIIMILTGAMLMFENFFFRYFPKWI